MLIQPTSSQISTKRSRKIAFLMPFLLSFSALTFAPQLASAQETEIKVIGTVAGEPITTQDLQLTIAEMGDQLGQVPDDQKPIAAMMALIDIRLLAQKAEAEKLGDSDEFQKRMAFLRQRALHNVLFRTDIVDKITDEEVRARYDTEVAATPPENELKASHILVETEEEAKQIIADLDAGGDFEAIAKEKSKDPGSANGGDLGYFGKGRMVPEFEAAAFALDIGSYTKEPVKTQFGFHVIRSDDLRPMQPPAFEQVSPQIRQVLLREKYFELLTTLRTDEAVKIEDPDYKAAYDAAIAQQSSQAQ